MRFSARTRPAPTGQCQFSASALARRVTERNRSATSPWGWPASWCHAVGGHILARIGTSRRRQVRPRGPRAFDQGTALRAVLPCGLPPCSQDALGCASRRAIAGAGDAALCNLPRCSTARVPSTSVSWPRWRHTHAAARALPGWCDAQISSAAIDRQASRGSCFSARTCQHRPHHFHTMLPSPLPSRAIQANPATGAGTAIRGKLVRTGGRV